MLERLIDLPPSLDLRSTIRGAKDPLLVGPSEVEWSTRTPDGPGSLELARVGPEQLRARAWGPGATWLVAQVPRLIGDVDDPTGFEPTGRAGELWRRRPFRLARTDRPWDAIVGAILGQKVQSTKAHRSRRLLARRFGEPAPGPNGSWILPSIDSVAGMGYADFHPIGVERKRAETLIRAARELRRSPLDPAISPTALQEHLRRVHGIGPWTSALVSAVSLGDADAVPIGDVHIPNMVAWLLAGEPRADDHRMLELLEPHVGHRWRMIRLAKLNGPAPRYGPRLSLRGDGLTRGS